MFDEAGHLASVDVWLGRAAKGLETEPFLRLFEKALHHLWQRTHLTLGSITLAAIADRVLHTASGKFPALSALKVEESGFTCHEFYECAKTLKRAEVEPWVRFLLVEFLTVLGSLTAEVLSPLLHEELSKVSINTEVQTDEGSQQSSRNLKRTGEEAKS
jgi:hypothetical protein